jgi:hypothetical protein
MPGTPRELGAQIMRVQVGDPRRFAERRLSRFSLPNQSSSSRILASQYEGSIPFTRLSVIIRNLRVNSTRTNNGNNNKSVAFRGFLRLSFSPPKAIVRTGVPHATQGSLGSSVGHYFKLVCQPGLTN